MAFNVKDYGALGNGVNNDTTAIQSAINAAKAASAPGGGAYRVTVYFPSGYYYITSPINITNTTGIWLQGDGGTYLNTSIIGNTSGAIFDFSGSSVVGCENFSFLSLTGYNATRSTIGVLFALAGNGGLNNGIQNCYFQMEDFPSANGGVGSIGILNVRSEEFYVHKCLIRANAPVIMSNSASLGSVGLNYTASSTYIALAAGTGTMGVTSMRATSIQNYEKRRPGLILNGTNSFAFQGYISRISATTGTEDTAILCAQYTTNLSVHATIESFSRVCRTLVAGFETNEFNVVVANSTAPTTELFDFTGCIIKGLKARISLPVPAERANRTLIYHAPAGGGYQSIPSSISNSEITCSDVAGNEFVISANLLKNGTNLTFNTNLPFEKKGGKIRQLYNNTIQAGQNGSPVTINIFQFRQANQLPFTSANSFGGFYRIWIDGVIRAGSYGSGGTAVMSFQAQLLVNQRNTGVFDPSSATVIVLDKTSTSPGYLDIAGALIDVSFASGVGNVTFTPRVMGTGTGEPIFYEGQAEIQSDFLVNDPIPIG
nr:glycosyl hydrolase family 28-related protein [uncultured Arsenicibacter sp.]